MAEEILICTEFVYQLIMFILVAVANKVYKHF